MKSLVERGVKTPKINQNQIIQAYHKYGVDSRMAL